MALPKYYNAGTASVAGGATAVTGTGTAWKNIVKADDRFTAQGLSVRIASVADNTHLTLAEPWPGTELTADPYEIAITYDGPEFQLRVRELLEQMRVIEATRPNLCFNPGMQVWQNDTTLAAMAHRTSLADGFLWGAANTTAVWTGERDTDVPDATVPYSIKVSCTTADAALASNEDAHIRYAIYGRKLFPYASDDLKVSFFVKSSKTGIHCLVGINEARNNCYVAEYTVNSANTWEEKTVTIPMGSKTGTWNTGDGFGIGLRWTLVCGPSIATTVGWQSGNYLGTSNQVNLADANTNVFKLAKVRVHAEEVPAFVLPNYDDVLQEALRQYRVITCDTAGVNFYGFAASSGNSVNFDMPISPPMYLPPTFGIKGTIDTDIIVAVAGGSVITGCTITSFARSRDIAKWTVDKTAGFTPYSAYALRLATTSGKLVLDGYLA